ncbi:MAG: methionyl-tRNA formyltransferase [Solirubrobacteraceae bacterium]|nr:methionyl-tRNA formyltransferase [Solirubrobacteraceae bacterium]
MIYLGTSDFAAGVLTRLVEAGHRPELVVTRPDAPKGRGRKLQPPPVAETARALGIELIQPEDVNSVDLGEPDAIVLCAYGALIREPLLSLRPILNLHPSLLPRWRGAAPIERAIMAGDAQTGVSIMRLAEELDAGPVCLAEAVEIAPDDTYGTLAPRLEERGAGLLARALLQSPPFVEQPADGVTYAERITAADRTLDPDAPPEVNERIVRALHPHIGARIELDDGTFLGVLRARVGDGGFAWHGLELLEVQPPGGKPMDAAAYLRGRG